MERALSTELVLRTGEAMHQTARERGLSAVFLASSGRELGALLEEQIGRSDAALAAMSKAIEQEAEQGAPLPDQEPGAAANPMGLAEAREAVLEFLSELPCVPATDTALLGGF